MIAALVAYKASSGDTYSGNQYHSNPTFVLFPLIGLAVSSAIIINLLLRKFTISDDGVSYKSIWGHRELQYNNIKGYRTTKNALYIIPEGQGYHKIMIRDFGSLTQDGDLRKWFNENYKDLNKADFEESKEEILQDATLGATKNDREEFFKTYRQYNLTYILGGMGMIFTGTIVKNLNIYLSLLFFVYPLLGMLLMAKGKGILRLFAGRNSAYSPVFIGLMFGSAALVLYSLKAEIIKFDKLWDATAIVALIVCSVLFYLSVVKVKASVLSQIFFVLFIGCIYAFGITLMINCTFDRSPVHEYPAKVEDAYITHGKSTSYTLVLGECNGFSGTKSITVSSSYYYNKPIGSIVNIDEKEGVLGAPWFVVKD
ncbi:MAG: hypothetical protein ACTHNW_02510 [Mucilaginibacter sp.]